MRIRLVDGKKMSDRRYLVGIKYAYTFKEPDNHNLHYEYFKLGVENLGKKKFISVSILKF